MAPRLLILWGMKAATALTLGMALTICACSQRNFVRDDLAAQDSGVSGRLVHTAKEGLSIKPTTPASGTVYVQTADRTQLAAASTTDADGRFTVALQPGRYYVYTEGEDYGQFGRRVTVQPRNFSQLELYLPPGR
jgi:hypothetical protein